MSRLGIHDTLMTESRAELLGFYSHDKDLTLARWQNGFDRVSYEGAAHHTLSLYSSGYGNAVRTDINQRGIDDSFCLMPAGTASQWKLEGPISFIHLYFNDRALARISERVFDKGSAHLSVPEITYQEDRELMLLSQWLLHSPMKTIESEPLLAEQNLTTVMTYLTGKLFRRESVPLAKGGLSPGNRRIVEDFIEANLDCTLHLRDLAELVSLSEFHFQRMFRQSFSIPPHEYINRLRVERAKDLIDRGAALASVALETGFSSQAHLTRVFGKYTGMTPGAFRKRL